VHVRRMEGELNGGEGGISLTHTLLLPLTHPHTHPLSSPLSLTPPPPRYALVVDLPVFLCELHVDLVDRLGGQRDERPAVDDHVLSAVQRDRVHEDFELRQGASVALRDGAGLRVGGSGRGDWDGERERGRGGLACMHGGRCACMHAWGAHQGAVEEGLFVQRLDVEEGHVSKEVIELVLDRGASHGPP
jgi:hypothetical protein